MVRMTGADYGERSLARPNQRSGYRERAWETRAGTVDLAIPKFRKRSYFPASCARPSARPARILPPAVRDRRRRRRHHHAELRDPGTVLSEEGREGNSRTMGMHGHVESDRCVVPMKPRAPDTAPDRACHRATSPRI